MNGPAMLSIEKKLTYEVELDTVVEAFAKKLRHANVLCLDRNKQDFWYFSLPFNFFILKILREDS